MSPEIFVIAGPNGAGKSTGAAVILPKRFPTEKFLNADDITKALATDSRIEAGKVMLRRMHELRSRCETFAFETTFAGKSHAGFLRQAQQAGYRLHIAYLWLSSVELAKKRVAARVQDGGHDVPPADIERRYWRGIKNFFELYLLWQTVGYYAIIQAGSLSWWLAAEPTKSPLSTTSSDSRGYDVQPGKNEDALLDKRLDDICAGLTEAVDREVERRQREGLPIYISENGKVVDLQDKTQAEPHS